MASDSELCVDKDCSVDDSVTPLRDDEECEREERFSRTEGGEKAGSILQRLSYR